MCGTRSTKDPAKHALMNKYWKRTEDILAKLMLELGMHKGRKDDKKLLSTVNKIKKKHNSLQQACRHIMDKAAQAHIRKIRSAKENCL